MLQLDLTKEEQLMWSDMLEYDYKDIHNEISNTENWEYKADLKKRQELIRKLIDALALSMDSAKV